MFIRCMFGIGNDRQWRQDGSQVLFARGPLLSACPLHSVPELSNRDCGNFKLLIRERSYPLAEVDRPSLTSDNDVCAQNYRHLLAGALSVLRPLRSSRSHAFASFARSSVFARTSARSRPKHTFSSSGTSRANGSPFFSNTNVTF